MHGVFITRVRWAQWHECGSGVWGGAVLCRDGAAAGGCSAWSCKCYSEGVRARTSCKPGLVLQGARDGGLSDVFFAKMRVSGLTTCCCVPPSVGLADVQSVAGVGDRPCSSLSKAMKKAPGAR